MSAQTGTRSIAPPPPSSRGMERLRGQVRHLRSTPNPVWMRELRQSARLTRTPFILMTVTVLTALLLCAIGGLMTGIGSSTPARTGVVLHQTFFSVAYFVVTLAGPAVAANSIASEREGRTWEALLLTGLSPRTIARGKFLAAYTNVGLYILMLAPVGALPFLFGGVTATEVIVSFGCLFVFAAVSVAFGLAVSAMMDHMRWAILWTLLTAFVLSPTIYIVLGVVLAHAVNVEWPMVPSYSPVWLPTAIERAPFGLPYLGCFVAVPLAGAALPSWFLYEVTLANLRSPNDDRSTGVRRWFVVTSLLTIAFGALITVFSDRGDRPGMATLGISLFTTHLAFCAFVFAGEPIGPSRLVLIRWREERASPFDRMLGPGVMRAALLLLAMGVFGLLGISAAAVVAMSDPTASRLSDIFSILVLGGYAACFVMFLTGFGAWLRARGASPATTRVMLVVIVFFAAAGPWMVAAIAGSLSSGGDNTYLTAALSPTYAFYAGSYIRGASSGSAIVAYASMGASVFWALLGLAFLLRASSLCRTILRKHDEAVAAIDARLAEEDAAAEPTS